MALLSDLLGLVVVLVVRWRGRRRNRGGALGGCLDGWLRMGGGVWCAREILAGSSGAGAVTPAGATIPS